MDGTTTGSATVTLIPQVAMPDIQPRPWHLYTQHEASLSAQRLRERRSATRRTGARRVRPGTIYTGPITVSASETIQAIAYESGMTDSAVGSAAYTINGIVATPTFSPAAGTFSSAQSVTIATSTSGATIRYTLDGSTPSETAGTVYGGAVAVMPTTTIKAIAYKGGWTDRAIASATYTISSPSWYNSSWSYRKLITISNSQVSGSSNLTNFPVLISLPSDSNLASSAQTNGIYLVHRLHRHHQAES